MSSGNRPATPLPREEAPPAGSTKPGAPESRIGLSHARIVETALSLLDREGLGRFSMRRLAEELGVGTMTIYGYFRSKDELLDAVIDEGASRIEVSTAPGSWREELRHLMLAVGTSLADHPSIVELRGERPLVSPGALRLTEVGMRILRDAGFDAREAARAYRALFVYTFGFSAFGAIRGSAEEEASTLEALRALPREQYPALLDSAPEAAASMADRTVFELGLELMLDGLERRLRADSI